MEEHENAEIVNTLFSQFTRTLLPLGRRFLEEFFVKKGLLEKNVLGMIKDAKLEVEYIRMIRTAKDSREIAQYSPTKRTTKSLAEETMNNAYKFVERMEEKIEDIKK